MSPVATLDAVELATGVRRGVWRLARRLRREANTGITPTLYAALFTIEQHEPITAGQLAAHENVRKPSVTRTIAALLEQGLITRTPDPLDGRVTWLQATTEGRRLLRRARRRSDEYLARRLAALTPSEQATLAKAAALLDRLASEEPAP
ncbi:MAG TPA: MarR family transcriptional regulator [Actinomycetota bacterium]